MYVVCAVYRCMCFYYLRSCISLVCVRACMYMTSERIHACLLSVCARMCLCALQMVGVISLNDIAALKLSTGSETSKRM